jgi:hypothetical protein
LRSPPPQIRDVGAVKVETAIGGYREFGQVQFPVHVSSFVAAMAAFDWCQREEFAAYFKRSFPNLRSYLLLMSCGDINIL